MRYVVPYQLIKPNVSDIVSTIFDTKMKGLFGGDYDGIEHARLKKLQHLVTAVFCTISAIRGYSEDNKELIFDHIANVIHANLIYDGELIAPFNEYVEQANISFSEFVDELYTEVDKSFQYHEADCSIAYAEMQEDIYSLFDESDLYRATRTDRYRFHISTGLKINIAGYVVVTL